MAKSPSNYGSRMAAMSKPPAKKPANPATKGAMQRVQATKAKTAQLAGALSKMPARAGQAAKAGAQVAAANQALRGSKVKKATAKKY